MPFGSFIDKQNTKLPPQFKTINFHVTKKKTANLNKKENQTTMKINFHDDEKIPKQTNRKKIKYFKLYLCKYSNLS